MDLLGSILGKMDTPPVPKLSAKEKEKIAEAKEREKKHKEEMKKFRTAMEKKIDSFVSDGKDDPCMVFPPMSKFQRTILHEVAEIADLVSHSFGEEDVDRHIVVWRKESPPDEDELFARKNGVTEYNREEAKRLKEERRKVMEEEQRLEKLKRKNQDKESTVEPKKNYREKYQHLIGTEAALEAAQKTQMNKSYGMVSAESKKDRRTVEQVQAEIRAKKQAKLQQQKAEES